jgi:hypothetical protein
VSDTPNGVPEFSSQVIVPVEATDAVITVASEHEVIPSRPEDHIVARRADGNSTGGDDRCSRPEAGRPGNRASASRAKYGNDARE